MPKFIMSGLTIASLLLLAGCAPSPEEAVDEPEPRTGMTYPETPTVEQIDDYHGTEVADPYRWLEDMASAEVQAWIAAQNELSFPYLEELPERDNLKDRLTELWNYERISTPSRHGQSYFYFRNDGLQDQSVLYVTDDIDQTGRPLIDPNQFSDDGTVSLSRHYVSPNASYVAYGISDGGSDWTDFRIRNVATGTDLPSEITGTKFTNIAWLPDETGFYYSRYPEGSDGQPDDQEAVRIYFHEIGSSQADDELIYHLDSERNLNPYPQVTRDGRFLLASISDGFDSNAVHLLNLRNPDAEWQPLFDDWDARYNFIASDANLLFFQTDNDAPTGRVIAVDINRPAEAHWEELISPREETLTAISYVGGKFFARYLEDASSAVRVYDALGRFQDRLELPGIGTVSGFTGSASHIETFFQFTSFTEPGAIYHLNIARDEMSLLRQSEVAADTEPYVTEQHFYTSADGTEVPMFIIRHEDTELDGSNPTLLYGYGGFNISLTPSFSVARLAWLEQGGIVAIPNLRGGGEYGADWHEAGTRLQKQNVFDDFIAAAEFLIAEQYTSPQHLGIQGGSNGGLLVGAVMNQRPELFGAALPAVGVLDMLRYHKPSANARAWSSDFGLSEDPAEFEALYAYSPVHTTEPGTCYPATLITTGDHDDRVVPWHSYKYAAVLQRDQGCDKPVLLRVETRAGHGAGTPTWMRIEQIADQWAFLIEHLADAPDMGAESD